MRNSITCILLFIFVSSWSVTSASAHSSEQTNAVIRAMLRRSLIRPNIDSQTEVLKSLPALTMSQEEFFAPDSEWTVDEKRAVFDWYLRNLSTTSIVRGVIAGRVWVDNPIACAAIAQCEVMAYTNALPALIENIRHDFDQSRIDCIRMAIRWCCPGDMIGIVNEIVTNDVRYTLNERNLAYRQFCSRVTDEAPLIDGVQDQGVATCVGAMYVRRDDPAGAVAIDKLLVASRPGYSNDMDRFECALSLLANSNALLECKEYFRNVTNDVEWAGLTHQN